MSGLARRSIYSKWLTRGQHAAMRPAHHYRGNLPDLATSLLPGVIIPHFTHQQEKSVSTFRAVVSAFWAFLSSRQSSSVLYWFYSTVSVLINKIFIHSFIHSSTCLAASLPTSGCPYSCQRTSLFFREKLPVLHLALSRLPSCIVYVLLVVMGET